MNKTVKATLIAVLMISLCILSGCTKKESKQTKYIRCTGNTMEPTYSEGQLLKCEDTEKVNKFERGDVVVFEAPSALKNENVDYSNQIAVYNDDNKSKVQYIKRIIGIAGDRIKIENNKVFLNGELLKEEYLKPETNTTDVYGDYTDITVPDGCIYVLGDNREVSVDSRRFGCIPIEKVEYRVIE